ncbi:MAG TPA: MBL fold metallo-hydrolase, partial [Armatimonadota bacterium]
PLLKPEEVTNADFVLLTHDHSDHIDPHAIPGIAKASPQARFVVSWPNVARLESLGVRLDRILGLGHGATLQEEGVSIHGFKSKHEFFDEDPELGFPHMGYVVDLAGARFYHPGDTIPWEGMIAGLRALAPQAAFLPINGRDGERYRRHTIGNCTFQESVDIAGEVGLKLAVPVHYDMFAGNPGSPPDFLDYLNAKYPEVDSWVGMAGERVERRLV